MTADEIKINIILAVIILIFIVIGYQWLNPSQSITTIVNNTDQLNKLIAISNDSINKILQGQLEIKQLLKNYNNDTTAYINSNNANVSLLQDSVGSLFTRSDLKSLIDKINVILSTKKGSFSMADESTATASAIAEIVSSTVANLNNNALTYVLNSNNFNTAVGKMIATANASQTIKSSIITDFNSSVLGVLGGSTVSTNLTSLQTQVNNLTSNLNKFMSLISNTPVPSILSNSVDITNTSGIKLLNSYTQITPIIPVITVYDVSKLYASQPGDIIYTAANTDIDVSTGAITSDYAKSIMTDTLNNCAKKCDSFPLCKGFNQYSWIPGQTTGACYLKSVTTTIPVVSTTGVTNTFYKKVSR